MSTLHDPGAAGPTAPRFNRSSRVPLEAVVRLHFEGEVSYQNGFSANVSASGMFVKHPEPHAVDSRMTFEFLVGSAHQPVQGLGHVVWVRERYEGPGKPAGMGIEFDELDITSREHLAEALLEHLEESLSGDAAPTPTPDFLPESPREAPPESAPESPAAPDAPRPLTIWEEAAAPLPVAPPPPQPPATSWDPQRDAPLAPPLLSDEERQPFSVPSLEAAAPKARRRGPALLGLAALLLLAAGGVGWWLGWWQDLFFQPAPAPPVRAAARPSPAPPPPTATAEPMAASTPTPAPAVPTPTPTIASLPAITPEPAAPAAPAMTSTAAFSRVRDVRFSRDDAGTTVVFALDGPIARGDVREFVLGPASPRLLLKLRGGVEAIARPPSPRTPELNAIRSAVHEGPELHVVLDLATAKVAPEISVSGSELTVRLARR